MKKLVLSLFVSILIVLVAFSAPSGMKKNKTFVVPHCDYTIYYGSQIIGRGHVDGQWCNEFFADAVADGNVVYK